MATVLETLQADMAALEAKYTADKAALTARMQAEASILSKDWAMWKAEVLAWYAHITAKSPPAA